MSDKKGYVINPKQYFPSVEAIYKARLNSFLALAQKHVYNRDLALDVVHDALAKAVEYFNKNKERKVREQIIRWLILKSCKRMNKYSREIPWGVFREETEVDAD